MVQGEGEVQEENFTGSVGSVGLLESVVDVRDGTGGKDQSDECKDSVIRGLSCVKATKVHKG